SRMRIWSFEAVARARAVASPIIPPPTMQTSASGIDLVLFWRDKMRAFDASRGVLRHRKPSEPHPCVTRADPTIVLGASDVLEWTGRGPGRKGAESRRQGRGRASSHEVRLKCARICKGMGRGVESPLAPPCPGQPP